MNLSSNENNVTEDVLPAVRQQRLREWFATNVSGSIQELSRMFSASISTIRRDLDTLAAEGVIKRTHGGAVSVRLRSAFEASVEQARITAVEEKRAIAVEAIKRLEPSQSILLDTGSTALEFAKLLAKTQIPLTVVTQDIQVAAVLSLRPHLRLIVPGGTCRPNAYTLLGTPGVEFISSLRCDICFLSSQAVDYECISDTMLELIRLKIAMINAARRTYLLVDSSRMASRAIYHLAPINRIHEIITDVGFEEEGVMKYAELGIPVTRVVPDEIVSFIDHDVE